VQRYFSSRYVSCVKPSNQKRDEPPGTSTQKEPARLIHPLICSRSSSRHNSQDRTSNRRFKMRSWRAYTSHPPSSFDDILIVMVVQQEVFASPKASRISPSLAGMKTSEKMVSNFEERGKSGEPDVVAGMPRQSQFVRRRYPRRYVENLQSSSLR
jgi:hypothetical protein